MGTTTTINSQLARLCGHWCLKLFLDKLSACQPSLAHVDREVILRENFEQLLKVIVCFVKQRNQGHEMHGEDRISC